MRKTRSICDSGTNMSLVIRPDGPRPPVASGEKSTSAKPDLA
jgi:hypothetical protein